MSKRVDIRLKRIQFTRAELEVINSMAAIADAAPWGQGDYLSFTEKYAKPYASMREKVWELIRRADGLPNQLDGAKRIK